MSRPLTTLTAPELLSVLREIEGRGHYDTAHRVRQRLHQVFLYAIVTGRADRSPAADLEGALIPIPTKHHAAVTTPRGVGALLRAIDAYDGHRSTVYALRLLPLTFVRPFELRHATWDEFDVDDALWRIPAARMKMSEAHLVPLSRQALAVLTELRALSSAPAGGLLFHSLRTTRRPISDNAMNAALRRMGFGKDEMTAHGFRSVANTLLNELGWSPDVIERQMAHQERNKVRAAYNRALYLDDRRRMMQAWADHLDALRSQR